MNKEALTNATTNILNKTRPLCEIQKASQERMSLWKDAEQILIFGYFFLIGKREYDLLHMTTIPQAMGIGRYLVPQVNINTFVAEFNQSDYFELAPCFRQKKCTYAHQK